LGQKRCQKEKIKIKRKNGIKGRPLQLKTKAKNVGRAFLRAERQLQMQIHSGSFADAGT